ncbi:MAG: energy-coupling factor transporter transmembrane component T [Eubacteriales bacterium]|nr:energy-coupling factor transporter transmembrane component T [Eubacteriales bacterium]
MRNTFATYHPIIEFGFFCVVIGIGMFMIHPVFLTIGTSAAFIFAMLTGGKGTLKFTLCFLLPVIALVTVVNPLVNHQGTTILFQLKYSYVTLEAVVYGLLIGLMLVSILLWFSSYNKVMTSDKFTYLFGRIMPSISLVFTMAMRFIPNYQTQIKKIADAQKAAGQQEIKTRKEKIHSGINIVSIMFTWALENSIDSADSMRARGYGLKNRSTFSIYRFDGRDGLAAVFLLVMTVIVLAGCISGACHVEYFPEIIYAKTTVIQMASYAAFACICYFPVFIEAKEVLVWKHLESKI